MNVGEICDRNVVVVGKINSIYAAARLMRDHHTSEVVVVESRHGVNIPLGLITDHDIITRVIAEELNLDAISVGDILSPHVLTANEEDEMAVTLKRMRHKVVRRILIVSQNKGLIGILSVDDILDTLTEQLNDIDQIVGSDLTNEMGHIANEHSY